MFLGEKRRQPYGTVSCARDLFGSAILERDIQLISSRLRLELRLLGTSTGQSSANGSWYSCQDFNKFVNILDHFTEPFRRLRKVRSVEFAKYAAQDCCNDLSEQAFPF